MAPPSQEKDQAPKTQKDNKSSVSCSRTCNVPDASSVSKWKYAGIAAVIFFILNIPFLYQLAYTHGGAMGEQFSDENGSPTMLGIALMSVVFFVLMRILLIFDI
jgi:hypothetical protein